MKDSELSKILDTYRKIPPHKELKKHNKMLVEELSIAHKKVEYINSLNEKFHKPIAIKSNSKSSQATSLLIFSDWHYEENVDPATINYKNEYNLKIAKKSGENSFANGLRLHEITAKEIRINDMIVGFLGDMMTGYIHEELIEENALSPTQSTLVLYDLLISGLQYLLDKTECNIKVICKFGNHGRTTLKKRISTGYKNSYEWLLYHFIAKHFDGENRIEFRIDHSYHTYIDVYNFVLRFHHGDYIKYGGGVGGITIPVNKAIAQWNKEKKADLDVFGHYHQLKLHTGSDNFVCNGSNIGYNAYAISIKAAYELPSQAFFLLDEKRGKTISAPIFVR